VDWDRGQVPCGPPFSRHVRGAAVLEGLCDVAEVQIALSSKIRDRARDAKDTVHGARGQRKSPRGRFQEQTRVGRKGRELRELPDTTFQMHKSRLPLPHRQWPRHNNRIRHPHASPRQLLLPEQLRTLCRARDSRWSQPSIPLSANQRNRLKCPQDLRPHQLQLRLDLTMRPRPQAPASGPLGHASASATRLLPRGSG
jgi:hypothetical protein